MANLSAIAGATKRSTGTILGGLFRIKVAYTFVIVLFIQAISLGIKNGGGTEILKALGERFFNITQGLQITSLDIITNGASFDGIFAFLLILWALFSNAYLIYLWIKLFVWIFGNSFLSNQSQGFVNISLAVLTFLLIQIFYLFIVGSPIEGQTNLDLIKTPIYSLIDFFKAVVLIFSSTNFKEVVVENIYHCGNSSSICII